MADEEAEQERLSRGGGGCVAELQRLGERLQELERELRESRAPAVEAATEYCQQLCQVRAPGVPSPFPPRQKGKRASERLVAERWSSLPWRRRSRRPAGAGRTRKAPLCGSRGGGCRRRLRAGGRELRSGRKIPPPLPFPFPNSGSSVPGAARNGARSAAGTAEGVLGGRPGRLLQPPLIVLWDYRAPRRRALRAAPTGLRPLWF